MPKAKEDKYDLLADVIEAICDGNNKIAVETLNSGRYSDSPRIPTMAGKIRFMGPYSENVSRAQSIKIGKISIVRIPVEKSRAIEKQKNNQSFDYSCTYIVRLPNGKEAEFLDTDSDFIQVWHAALRRYDIDNNVSKGPNQDISDVIDFLYRKVKHNSKLADAASMGWVPKN